MLADYGDDGVFPCRAPSSEDIFSLPYTFSLVFWEVKQPFSEQLISPYYTFYKLLLRLSDKMEGGTAADCYIPLYFSTYGSMGVGT